MGNFSEISEYSSSSLGDECVVGEGTEIGQDAKIRQSIIGRNVTIGIFFQYEKFLRNFLGANAKIEGSYIWDGATIGEGAVIKHSIVCRDAKILENSKIEMSLISYDVTASFLNI